MRPKYQASFARRLGRSLSPRQQQLLQTYMPALQANHSALPTITKINVEIGFGNGEHIFQRALEAPNELFIGCEPYLNGVVSLLSNIEEHNVSNIKIHTEDARLFIDSMPDESIDCLYVLYPDPWPKQRQQKRRLLSSQTLTLFFHKLKMQGNLYIATDHADYSDYIKQAITDCGLYSVNYQSTPPDGWISTKYERKARSAGIIEHHYFSLIKKG